LPGIGKYAVDAVGQQRPAEGARRGDAGAFFIVLANLIVDILYAVVDPRVRLS
jgi:peptide/nickel transport system permease protein